MGTLKSAVGGILLLVLAGVQVGCAPSMEALESQSDHLAQSSLEMQSENSEETLASASEVSGASTSIADNVEAALTGPGDSASSQGVSNINNAAAIGQVTTQASSNNKIAITKMYVEDVSITEGSNLIIKVELDRPVAADAYFGFEVVTDKSTASLTSDFRQSSFISGSKSLVMKIFKGRKSGMIAVKARDDDSDSENLETLQIRSTGWSINVGGIVYSPNVQGLDNQFWLSKAYIYNKPAESNKIAITKMYVEDTTIAEGKHLIIKVELDRKVEADASFGFEVVADESTASLTSDFRQSSFISGSKSLVMKILKGQNSGMIAVKARDDDSNFEDRETLQIRSTGWSINVGKIEYSPNVQGVDNQFWLRKAYISNLPAESNKIAITKMQIEDTKIWEGQSLIIKVELSRPADADAYIGFEVLDKESSASLNADFIKSSFITGPTKLLMKILKGRTSGMIAIKARDDDGGNPGVVESLQIRNTGWSINGVGLEFGPSVRGINTSTRKLEKSYIYDNY